MIDVRDPEAAAYVRAQRGWTMNYTRGCACGRVLVMRALGSAAISRCPDCGTEARAA